MLSLYLLKDPRSGKIEQVYKYPEDLASPMLRLSSCILVTKQLLTPPIFVVPKEYLTEMDGQGITTDPWYASFEYLDYKDKELRKQGALSEYDSRMNRVKEIFSMGTYHKRSCKTIFFTGPKPVYKCSFVDNWGWKDCGILCLTNIGTYRTIESLSLKGMNEVFINGIFECGDEVMKDTQCKITVSCT